MWIAVTLQADAARAEALSDALMEAGALSVSIEDADAGTAAETPQFGEPGHLPAALWQHSRVIALFDGAAGEATLSGALSVAAHAAGFDAIPPFTTEEVAREVLSRLEKHEPSAASTLHGSKASFPLSNGTHVRLSEEVAACRSRP